MLKLVLGVAAGVVVLMALVTAGQYLLHLTFPMPAVDVGDKAVIQRLMAEAPTGAKMGLIVVYTVAAFGAALAAARVSARRLAGLIATGVMLALTIANYVMLPHPVWLVAASLGLIAAGGWFGARAGAKT